jgi:hypothetical protein
MASVTEKRNLLIVQYVYKADAKQTAACHKILARAKITTHENHMKLRDIVCRQLTCT